MTVNVSDSQQIVSKKCRWYDRGSRKNNILKVGKINLKIYEVEDVGNRLPDIFSTYIPQGLLNTYTRGKAEDTLVLHLMWAIVDEEQLH